MRVRLGIVALCAVAMTGCSLAQPQLAPVAAPPAAAPAPGQGAPGQRSTEGGYWPVSIQLGRNSALGPVIVDGEGFTLYRFEKDTAQPSRSNCSGQCAQDWPPALASSTVTFQNLDRSVLGTVQRSDGTLQLTAGGWPLYRYAKDTAPGQATGQGVGGTWYAAAPDGSRAGGSGR